MFSLSCWPADLVAWQTTLLGVPIPRNSHGVLPLDLLAPPTDDADFARRAARDNTRAIHQQFAHKQGRLRFSPVQKHGRAR